MTEDEQAESVLAGIMDYYAYFKCLRCITTVHVQRFKIMVRCDHCGVMYLRENDFYPPNRPEKIFTITDSIGRRWA